MCKLHQTPCTYIQSGLNSVFSEAQMFPLLTVEQYHYKHCSVTELKRVLWLVQNPPSC